MKLVLALLAVTNAAVLKTPSAKVALKLRGGLGDIDGQMVAKGLTIISGAQSAMMALDPEGTAGMYEMTATGVNKFMIANGGALILGTAYAAWQVINGEDAAASMATGIILSVLMNLKDLSQDTAGSLGWGTAPKYVPLIVNGLIYCGLSGRLDFASAADTLKYMSWWLIANGGIMYLSPDKGMEMWQAKLSGGKGKDADKVAKEENAMVKLFGAWLAGTGAFTYGLSEGKGAVTSIGYNWAVLAVAYLDSLYTSKWGTGDEQKMTFWAWLAAAGAATMLF